MQAAMPENDRFRSFRMVKYGSESEPLSLGSFAGRAETSTRRSGSAYGGGRSSSEFATVNMAVFAPMPRPRMAIATNVKPRFFASILVAYRKSRTRDFIPLA